MKDFLLGIGINVGLAVSGFFGSLLLVGQQKDLNLKDYLTPIVIDAMGSDNESLHFGMAFVIGFGGLKVVEYFYHKWFNKKENDSNNN